MRESREAEPWNAPSGGVPVSRRDEIVDAAIAISEEVGVDNLSMRLIGKRMGTSAMAIYRHVPSREALLDAMVGRVLASVALPGPEKPWPERLRVIGHGLLDAAQANPTVFPMVLTRTYQADEAIAVMRSMYEVLAEAEVPPDAVPRVERMVSTALIGYAVAASTDAFWAVDPTLASRELRVPDVRSAGGAPERWHDELDQNVDDLVMLVQSLARKDRRSEDP
ncbi:helix-turn-helix domain-containing protein [Actinopolymorpha sp. B17G11]|uniref:TetR/AcrR family transcriptional regulator n=1 Tax=Actinopolymorpha sp. B17G11 TaxID=3160861 RepID=UPI0032E3B8E1